MKSTCTGNFSLFKGIKSNYHFQPSTWTFKIIF